MSKPAQAVNVPAAVPLIGDLGYRRGIDGHAWAFAGMLNGYV